MLLDLLCPTNLVSFNIKIAEITGLHAAIYLSELISINDKAMRKNKIQDNSFTIDREYILRRTTLEKEEQLELDDILIKIGIIKRAELDPNLIKINFEFLTDLISNPDPKLIEEGKKISKKKPKQSKQTKSEIIKDELKKYIQTTNEELLYAYREWIDTVYAKQGWMSKKSVIEAQNVIDNFSKRDLDIALKIIDIATMNGYRDMTWAINLYNKEGKNKSYINISKIQTVPKESAMKLSEEVF